MILAYKLGAWMLGDPVADLRLEGLDWEQMKTILIQHSKPLLLGCSIIGFVAAVLSYFVCYRLIVYFRRKDAALAETDAGDGSGRGGTGIAKGGGNPAFPVFGPVFRSQAMVWRMSFPLTMKITISAMLVAWSAIRSSDLEM